MPRDELYESTQGTGSLTAVGDQTIISSPGSGKKLRITHAIVSVLSVGTDAVIALENGAGGTKFWATNQVGTHVLNFGPRGYELSEDTALNLTVETANSTAYCTAVGYIVREGYEY